MPSVSGMTGDMRTGWWTSSWNTFSRLTRFVERGACISPDMRLGGLVLERHREAFFGEVQTKAGVAVGLQPVQELLRLGLGLEMAAAPFVASCGRVRGHLPSGGMSRLRSHYS